MGIRHSGNRGNTKFYKVTLTVFANLEECLRDRIIEYSNIILLQWRKNILFYDKRNFSL